METSLRIEYEFKCHDCNTNLDIDFDKFQNIIYVQSCEECFEKLNNIINSLEELACDR